VCLGAGISQGCPWPPFLAASIAHLVLADGETVEPTFAICLTPRGVAPHAQLAVLSTWICLILYARCRLEPHAQANNWSHASPNRDDF
jgi:hypothetical protein